MATELAMSLARRNHEVHLVNFERPFRLMDSSDVHFHRVNVTQYPLFRFPPHDLCLANRLAEVVTEHDIDIIHAHYAIPHAISAILAAQIVRPHPVKVVTTLHGTDITLVGSHRDFYRACRYAMCECDGLTAVSAWLRDQSVSEFNLSHSPMVIPNFVDTGRFNPIGRQPFPVDGTVQVMHASNYRPVKRVFDVVRVFHRIVESGISARLVMVGEGPELGLARELASELHICDRVHFPGAVVNLEEIYRQSHLFLLPSEYESFGLSALEAQACGTPVIASDAGGLPEVVQDGVTGFRCRVGDVETMSTRAIDLLKNPTKWSTMSTHASDLAQEHFETEAVVPRYEKYYEDILNGTIVSSCGGSR